MRKDMFKFVSITIVAIALMALFVTVASAAPAIFTGKVDSVTKAVTRNGNPYGRIIMAYQDQVEGVDFENTIPVMLFGQKAALADTLQEGQEIRFVGDKNEYQGRWSIRMLKLLE